MVREFVENLGYPLAHGGVKIGKVLRRKLGGVRSQAEVGKVYSSRDGR
jgi:hypothetical protein